MRAVVASQQLIMCWPFGMIYFNECHLLMCLVIVDPHLILKTLSGVKRNKLITHYSLKKKTNKKTQQIMIHRFIQLSFPRFNDVTGIDLTAAGFGAMEK